MHSWTFTRLNERKWTYACLCWRYWISCPPMWIILEPIRNPRSYALVSLNLSLTRMQELIVACWYISRYNSRKITSSAVCAILSEFKCPLGYLRRPSAIERDSVIQKPAWFKKRVKYMKRVRRANGVRHISQYCLKAIQSGYFFSCLRPDN